jgi:glycosyltransferase involved in cell wall biosynthesis
LDSAREIRVLFIKSDYERGGLRRLIFALQQLKEYSFQLTIAGPEETDVRERLGDMLNANAQLKFHFAGPVTQADTVMNLYHTHHLVCVPSEREALGLVNAEALASGTPVVSVKVGGIPEILADGKAGWLATENTVPALAAAIRGCITHRAETQQKAMFGREHVLKKYSITSFRSAFMVALRDIMSKKSSE